MKLNFLPLLLSLGLFASAADAQAQHNRIVAGQLTGVRHVQPTTPITFACGPAGQCIELDVDGDGSKDLSLKAYNVSTGGASGVYIVEMQGMRPEIELAGTDSATWSATDSRHTQAIPLSLNDSVSARPLSSGRYVYWQKATSTNAASVRLLFSQSAAPGGQPTVSGYWRSAGTRYLGLRIAQSTGGYRYGWLQTEMLGSSVSVGSYAAQAIVMGIRPLQVAAMQVYPNPVAQHLRIQLPAATAAHLEILDALGRSVLTRELSASAELVQIVDASSLLPGMYTVRVRTAAGSISQRITKV